MKKRRIGISVPIAIVLLLALVYVAVSWHFSSLLIARPTHPLEAVDFTEFGLPEPEEVTIESGAVKLAGWFFANPRAASCAVIMMHGYTFNRTQPLVGTPLFWERGCDLLLYDARGHGESTPAFHTYGFYEKQDELRALEWLSQRTGLPRAKIALMGWSYGAATSLQMAPLAPDVAFVIADSSYSSLRGIAEWQGTVQFGEWTKIFIPGALVVSGLRAGFDAAQASPAEAVKGLSTPILLIHSKTDAFTPYTHSEAIYANSNPAQTVLHINEWGAPHAEDYIVDPAAYTQRVDEFLAEKVPGFGVNRVSSTRPASTHLTSSNR